MGFIALGAIISGLIWLWAHVPEFYDDPTANGRLQAIAITRTGILGVAAGLVALAAVLESRRATNLTHARELYTEAVSQLGSDTLDIRLGGIYALERIATAYASDHRTVVEVLSAFVREHATPDAVRGGRRTAALPTPAERAAGTAARTPAKPDTDIQAALTVMGRLRTRARVPRADLTGAHVPGAELIEADLTGARLNEADLTGARLYGADLTGARLYGADLTGARLYGADLSGAHLDDADLTGARLGRANLTGVQLNRANLTGAALGVADLTRARLSEADLTDAALGLANLTAAILGGANLTGAWLGGADLTGTWLGGADLTGARLGGTDLTGAEGLTPSQLEAAAGDRTTVLPDGLTESISWSIRDP